MKKQLYLVTTIASLFAFVSVPATGSELFADRHRCSLDSSKMIKLAENGESRAEIVIGGKSCPVVAFAAKELKTFLDQVTGADFKIVNQRSGNTPAIFLGDSGLAKEMNIDVASLPRDAFVIKSSGQDIVIAGRDNQTTDPKRGTYLWGILYERGTLSGVYDFLERFTGTRFFFPGKYGTVVPKTKNLEVPQMNIYEEPDCLTRRVSLGNRKEKVVESFWYEELLSNDLPWTLTLMNLRCRVQSLYIPNDHGLASRGFIKRWGKTHPEYFALHAIGTRSNDISEEMGGQLCYSNEGLRKEIFEDAKSYLTGEAANVRGVYCGDRGDKFGWYISSHFPGYFDLGPQDGLGEGNWCHCDKCWPYWKNNRQTDLIWGMVADIANRLKKEKIPGFVTCSAYACYGNIPDVTLPDNVFISLCVTGPWAEASPLRQTSDHAVMEWSKLCNKRLDLRNYMNDYAGGIPLGVPPVSSRLIAQYYQKTAPFIAGAYVQADISYALHNQFPNGYLIYKYLWNSKLDINEQLTDSMSKLFGPAAKPMSKFFERLEEIWTKSFAGNIVESPLGPSLAPRSEREVWDAIYTPDVFKEFDALFAEAEKLAASDGEAKMRVLFFRDKYLGEMKRARNAYYALNREVDDLVLDVAPVNAPIVVDGKLDDEAWKACPPVYLVPVNGDDPRVETAVRILWSADTLYLAFDSEEPKIDAMKLAERKRDDGGLWKNDSVEIFLNPSGDRKNYYHVTVDAHGVIADEAVNSNGGSLSGKINLNWNCDVQAKTAFEKDRWTAEMAIPIKALQSAGVKPGDSWVANFNRSRHVTGEEQYMSWSPFLKDGFHDPGRFGRLRFAAKTEDRSGWILQDGSFEGEISGRMLETWHLPTKAEEKACITIDNTTYRDGCQSICIYNAKPDDLASISHNLPSLKPDTNYVLTFWIKGENINKVTGKFAGALVNINWPGRNFNSFWPRGGYSGTFGWTKQAIKFKTPPAPSKDIAKNTAWLNLRFQFAPGKVWFDDVRIREINDKGEIK